jgi:hypothetical protein
MHVSISTWGVEVESSNIVQSRGTCLTHFIIAADYFSDTILTRPYYILLLHLHLEMFTNINLIEHICLELWNSTLWCCL